MSLYRSFQGMTWPAPGEFMSNLSWRLRYAPESITFAEKLQLASVLDAYRELIFLPRRQHSQYTSELRQGPNLFPPKASPKEST